MNHNEDLTTRLVWEIEDSMSVDGSVDVYEFSWALRGLLKQDRIELDPDQFDLAVMAAYEEVRRKHDLRLVWMLWPSEYVAETEADVALDFELDQESDDPYLVLVPADRRFDAAGATDGE